MNVWDDPRVQRGMKVQLAERRRRIDAGEVHLGWKIGFGAPAAMAKLGIAGPLIGFMTDRSLVASDSTVSVAGWSKPVAETEIAAYVGNELPAGAGPEAVADAIVALGPAIELADLDRPPQDPEAILSGNIYHRHVILGPRDSSRAGARVDAWSGRVVRNGEEMAHVGDVQANTGKILGLVTQVANTLLHFDERLRRGDVIICGSIVPPIELRTDDEEIAYSLEPGDWACSVRFEHG